MGPIGRIAGAMLISPFVSQKVRVYVAKAGSATSVRLPT